MTKIYVVNLVRVNKVANLSLRQRQVYMSQDSTKYWLWVILRFLLFTAYIGSHSFFNFYILVYSMIVS